MSTPPLQGWVQADPPHAPTWRRVVALSLLGLLSGCAGSPVSSEPPCPDSAVQGLIRARGADLSQCEGLFEEESARLRMAHESHLEGTLTAQDLARTSRSVIQTDKANLQLTYQGVLDPAGQVSELDAWLRPVTFRKTESCLRLVVRQWRRSLQPPDRMCRFSLRFSPFLGLEAGVHSNSSPTPQPSDGDRSDPAP